MNTPNPQDQAEAIKAALLAGNKIKAIQLYRSLTNVGLAEAKNAVEKMEAQFRLSGSLEVTLPTPIAHSENLAEAIKEALFAGHKIAAIKLYRGQNKVGLAEAKDAIEKIEAQLRLSSPGSFSSPAVGKGCLVSALIFATLGAALWKMLP